MCTIAHTYFAGSPWLGWSRMWFVVLHRWCLGHLSYFHSKWSRADLAEIVLLNFAPWSPNESRKNVSHCFLGTACLPCLGHAIETPCFNAAQICIRGDFHPREAPASNWSHFGAKVAFLHLKEAQLSWHVVFRLNLCDFLVRTAMLEEFPWSPWPLAQLGWLVKTWTQRQIMTKPKKA